MARRDIGEINAGSMADIAFLLLIFFLVTTTMDFDMGIKRVLPQKVDIDKVEPVKVLERNVLEIKANLNDQLMVNKMETQVEELQDKVIEFMNNPDDKANLPEMITIDKDTCDQAILKIKAKLLENPDDKVAESDLADWEAKYAAFKLAGTYRVIPKLCVITVQTDNQTSYKLYIQIQDALKGAINDMRNEWGLRLFDKKFTDLKDDNPEDVEKIKIIRAIVPERIAEIEPRNIQEF